MKNQADTLIYTTEKTLNENREKLDSSDIKSIEDAISELKNAVNGNDINLIREKMNNLNQASHKIAEIMYKQAQQAQAGAAGGGTTPPGEGGTAGQDSDVVDAEFEESDKS